MNALEDILGIPLKNSSSEQPVICVAPLDWGLGHASRCVPLIEYYLQKGVRIILWGYGASGVYLRSRFPDLEFEQVSGPRIKYARGWILYLKLPWLTLKYLYWIRKEHLLVVKLVRKYRPVMILSDSRPGLYSDRCLSIILNSQLNPIVPKGFRFLQGWSSWLMAQFMNKFHRVWVPDDAGPKNLLGKLSVNRHIKKPVDFLGPLSRFHGTAGKPGSRKQSPQQVLCILSGPEPNRTQLENKLLEQIKHLPYQFTLIRGLAGDALGKDAVPMEHRTNCSIYQFLDGSELKEALESADLVVCRPGYSTLMDLYFLQKKCLLIPTPGQTEQQYLGARVHNRGQGLCVKEKKLNLKEQIPLALKRNTLAVNG